MKKDYSEKSRKNMIGQMVEDDNLYSRSDMVECGIKNMITGVVVGAVGMLLICYLLVGHGCK